MPLGNHGPRVSAASSALPLIGPWFQTSGGVWIVDSEYECDRLRERLMTKGETFGWDTETEGVNPRKESAARGVGRIVCWSAAFFDDKLGQHPETGYPLAQRVFVKNWGEAIDKRWLYKFQEWFEDEAYSKVGANVFSFDKHVLRNHGITLRGITFDNVRASRLNDPSSWSHSLKDQGAALGYTIRDYNELFQRPVILKNGREGKKMALVPLTEVVKDPAWLTTLIDYASMDAKMSLEAWPWMADKLKSRRWAGERTMLDFYNERLNPYMYVLTGMEQHGWDLDVQWCFEQGKIAEYDASQLERKLVEWAGARLNFGSPVQLAHLLYGRETKQVVKSNPVQVRGRGFAIPPVSRPRKIKPGQEPSPPTDDIALSYLASHSRSKRDQEGIRALLEWRTVTKTKQYLDKLPLVIDVRGDVHPGGYKRSRVHCQVAPDTECMPAGELVLTSRGYIPVESVRVGDSVLTHEGRSRRVARVCDNGVRTIYRVRSSNGLVLRTTGNHKFLTEQGWRMAYCLDVGDQVVVYSGPEVWRPIEGWSLFEVSSWGRVRNVHTNHLMKLYPKGKWGHLKVQLYRNGAQTRQGGDRKDFTVHRLVAQAFFAQEWSPDRNEVRHLNGLAWDNTVDNLAWGTTKENGADAIAHGSRSHRQGVQAKLSEEAVAEIRADSRSSYVVSKLYNVSASCVRQIRQGVRWQPQPISAEVSRCTFFSVAVESVDVEEKAQTYGLTVEEDCSHVTGGMVTHNTGRLSAKNPPLQQIQKPGKDPVADRYSVREAFTCPPGWGLICADYSQLEMRILAHFLVVLFKDTKLADDLSTGDLHAATALRTFGRDEVMIPEAAPVSIDVARAWAELDPFTSSDAKWMNEMQGLVRDTPLGAVKKFFPSFRDKGKIVNFCVSEDTLALTPQGWKRHDQLRPGMLVLGRTGWVKINKVHRYEDTELVDMWGFHVTRQHRWWAERRTTRGGGPRRYLEEFVQTDQFTAEHRARLSTPQQFEDRSGLTPSEAALIGWLLTDGHVNKQACSVFQKNPLFIPVLDELFKAYPHSRYVRPSGIVQWRLKQSVAEKYRRICDNISEDFVLSLGPEQRRRFVEAGWRADGVTKRRKPWGKYLAREPERSRFDQNAGSTADAFRLAMFLEGYYVSQSEEVSRTGKRFLHMTMSSPYKTRQRKPPVSVGRGMSWCLETEDSTFTIRRGDRIAITGNSVNYGKTAFGLGKDLRDENDDPIGDEAAQDILDAYFRAYPGILSYKTWAIEYARKRGYARSILGRYRPLPHIWQEIDRIRRHAERQAQNTPIQASAMDVAMSAQLKTNTIDVPVLRDLGFFDDELARMDVQHIMQVHDELVFRCPWSHIEEACARVKLLMEDPLEKPLTVALPAEVGHGTSWREAH